MFRDNRGIIGSLGWILTSTGRFISNIPFRRLLVLGLLATSGFAQTTTQRETEGYEDAVTPFGGTALADMPPLDPSQLGMQATEGFPAYTAREDQVQTRRPPRSQKRKAAPRSQMGKRSDHVAFVPDTPVPVGPGTFADVAASPTHTTCLVPRQDGSNIRTQAYNSTDQTPIGNEVVFAGSKFQVTHLSNGGYALPYWIDETTLHVKIFNQEGTEINDINIPNVIDNTEYPLSIVSYTDAFFVEFTASVTAGTVQTRVSQRVTNDGILIDARIPITWDPAFDNYRGAIAIYGDGPVVDFYDKDRTTLHYKAISMTDGSTSSEYQVPLPPGVTAVAHQCLAFDKGDPHKLMIATEVTESGVQKCYIVPAQSADFFAGCNFRNEVEVPDITRGPLEQKCIAPNRYDLAGQDSSANLVSVQFSYNNSTQTIDFSPPETVTNIALGSSSAITRAGDFIRAVWNAVGQVILHPFTHPDNVPYQSVSSSSAQPSASSSSSIPPISDPSVPDSTPANSSVIASSSVPTTESSVVAPSSLISSNPAVSNPVSVSSSSETDSSVPPTPSSSPGDISNPASSVPGTSSNPASSSNSWVSSHVSQPSSGQQVSGPSEQSQPEGGNNSGMIAGIAAAAGTAGLFAAGGAAYAARRYWIGAHRDEKYQDPENGNELTQIREPAPFDGGQVSIDVTIDPNDVLFDQRAKLGGGAFGAVFAGTYTRKDKARQVAIKHSPDTTPEGQKLTMREVGTAMSLVHKNIVKFYGVVINSEGCFVVMERCDGSLSDLLYGAKKEPLTWPQVGNIACQIASGIAYLHNKGFLHRDIKPQNILFNWQAGLAKVADFDTAKKLNEMAQLTYESVLPREDKPGMTKGGYTLVYAPPELINCAVDPSNIERTQKIDVYEFAMLLYEIVSGQAPFADVTATGIGYNAEVCRRIVAGQLPQIPVNCPPALKVLIEQCWKINPDERPTMAAVTNALHLITERNYNISETEVMASLQQPTRTTPELSTGYSTPQYT